MPEMTQPKPEQPDAGSDKLQASNFAAGAETKGATGSDSNAGGDKGDQGAARMGSFDRSAIQKSLSDRAAAQQASDKGGANAEQMAPPEQKKPAG